MSNMKDEEIRQFFRDEIKSRLNKLRSGDVEKTTEKKQEIISSLRSGPIAAKSCDVNQEVYEVPKELCEVFLGKRLKWSTCFFTTGEETIDEAEEAMLDLSCRRCQLEDGMKVLDLGCGWGSLAFWITEKYKSCHVTCVSNSKAQMMYLNTIVKEKGVSEQINCITADMNNFDTTEKFDRVMAIEMFEHMTNFELLMEKIAKWLKKDGMLFIQTLGHRELPHYSSIPSRDEPSHASSALQFLNSSADMLLYFQKDLLIVRQWIFNGRHTAATIRHWHNKMHENKDHALRMFVKAYPNEDAENSLFEWKWFFLFAEENHSYNEGNEFISCQLLFKRR